MADTLKLISVMAVIAPLIGSIIAGLFGKRVGKAGAHSVTILGVLIAFVGASYLFYQFFFQHMPKMDFNLYTWAVSGYFSFQVGFLLDNLTAIMLVVVTFVSLLVHIYSIGYMEDDPGYQRFFSYMSLFTFMMLMLVMANKRHIREKSLITRII